MTIVRCPIRNCETLILPTRLACFGHLMVLPAETRAELSRLSKFAPGSDRQDQAKTDAVAYLNRLQPERRAS